MPRILESRFRTACPAVAVRCALFVAALAALAMLGPAAPPARAQSASDPAPFAQGAKGESSVGILFGVGWYDNDDFNDALAEIGVEPIENGFEYGVQYRKRLGRFASLGAEVLRMDGRSTTNPGGVGSEFGLAGTSLFIDAFFHPAKVGGGALTLFAGGGPVFAIRLSQTFPDGVIAEGKKTGFGWHVGAEGEGRFGENFGFFVRGLTRRAGVDDIIVSDDPLATPITFDADFDGLAITFGPRWYFGGEGRQ